MLEELTVECPHCGEQFATTADLSEGGYSTVEDCQVCCRPMEITITGSVGHVLRVEVLPL